YRFSRNPMYIGDFFIFIGIAISCLSWIYLIVTILVFIVNHLAVLSEEHECIAKYGQPYREYMEKIPRWLGRPK
ncbi:MAG: methyltransferase family protein, partial [Promethearchaeota archaeon]